jgi:hypothetical protein
VPSQHQQGVNLPLPGAGVVLSSGAVHAALSVPWYVRSSALRVLSCVYVFLCITSDITRRGPGRQAACIPRFSL